MKNSITRLKRIVEEMMETISEEEVGVEVEEEANLLVMMIQRMMKEKRLDHTNNFKEIDLKFLKVKEKKKDLLKLIRMMKNLKSNSRKTSQRKKNQLKMSKKSLSLKLCIKMLT